ncbi:MAG: hypothetical protein JW995_11690 [Melioribacteraceae bacterium]|nr:hypothetical protein [Melioribacteraceae bacterium]
MDGWFKSSSLIYGYEILLIPNIVKYINNSDWFYSADVYSRISLNKTERFSSRNYEEENIFIQNDVQQYDVTFGFGYGKMRNVTPLVQAARLQNRLMVLNKLNKPFDNETMIALAQQLSKSSAYNNVYDRPEKYFWNDIESTLNSHGISLSTLNQYAASYLREVENEIRFMRYEGFMINPLLGLEYRKSRYYYGPGDEDAQEGSLLLFGFAFDYCTQLNLYSQFRNNLVVKGGSFMNNHPEYKQEHNLINTTTYAYEVTDRFILEVENEFMYKIINYTESGSETENSFVISAYYFWEDYITSSLQYRWLHTKFEKHPDRTDDFTVNNHSLYLEFSYAFMSNFLRK